MGIKARLAWEVQRVPAGFLGWGGGTVHPDSKPGLSSWLATAHAPQRGSCRLAWATAMPNG